MIFRQIKYTIQSSILTVGEGTVGWGGGDMERKQSNKA